MPNNDLQGPPAAASRRHVLIGSLALSGVLIGAGAQAQPMAPAKPQRQVINSGAVQ